MSNTEIDPVEYECAQVTCADQVDIITAREVPLGGPRAMTVRRTLPQRKRSLIGPWCFMDHFGPDDVASTGGMAVPRHPHTGLATVTLLFAGNIDHVDSTGFANTVRPGEVNLMIAGAGVSHSEFSTEDTSSLHGVQLWYALPDGLRDGSPESQHHVSEAVEQAGGTIRVHVGSLAGLSSPVDTRVPAVAAEITVRPGQGVDLDLDPEDEHGVLVDQGRPTIVVEDHRQSVAEAELAFLPAGPGRIRLEAGDEPARVVLVGGRPFGEQIVMWWNFVGRTHEDIAAYREAWQAEIAAGPATVGRFGPFPEGEPDALPAPPLPNVRIKPREQ